MKDSHNGGRLDPAALFNKGMSEAYDAKNAQLAPIADNLHFLMRLALADLPPQARLLCVGIGTGADILALAGANPDWSFVGVDPSADMLAVCRRRLEEAGLASRCRLVQGYVEDVPAEEKFDAVVSLLVGHFVPRDDKVDFYRHMQMRLKPGGSFVNAEISYDLDSVAFPSMLKNWARVQSLMGATPESLEALPDGLRHTLSVQAPDEIEAMMQTAGIDAPVRFFQSFMICGWYGHKTDGAG